MLETLLASRWHVFPIRPNGKTPAISGAHPGDDPRRGTCRGQCGQIGHGCWDATTDAARIQGWARAYPGCNWAVHPGVDGMVVLDIDVKHDAGGQATWSDHVAREGHVPTFTVHTPSGGWHLYYRLPPGLTITTRALLGTGVDVRSTGGYVLLPGSFVDDGDVHGAYVVTEHHPVAELPAWIAGLYRADTEQRVVAVPHATHAAAADVQQRLLELRDEIAELPEGEGANGASRTAFLAGQYVGAGQGEADAVIALLISGLDDWAWRTASDETALHRQITKGVHDGMRSPRPWAATREREDWQIGQDFFAHTFPELFAPTRPAPSSRPFLDITETGAALERLTLDLGTGRLAGLFHRGGRIVHTPRMGQEGYVPPRNPLADDGPAQVRHVDSEMLGALIDASYRVVRLTAKGEPRAQHLPRALASRALGAAEADLTPNIRDLAGVTHTPIVRPDGSILAEPGYDESTRLLYLPTTGTAGVVVPDRPTGKDVATAAEKIRYPISQFPFATSGDAANWLGCALTPLLRAVAGPPYQLGIIEAANPGAGKGFLLGVLRSLHGVAMRPGMPSRDEEWSKVIMTMLSTTTAPIIAFDNVRGVIRSAALEALLTMATVGDRVLGRNDQGMSLANDRLWMMTGNNAQYGGDLARRVLRITIDPGMPDPQYRTGFRCNPVAWTRDNRADYLSALLTVVRAWALDGAPRPATGRSDDYAHWITTVRGILAYAGFEGEFAGSQVRTEASRDDEEWADFLAAVVDVFGLGTPFTARSLHERIESDWRDGDQAEPGRLPRDLLPGILAAKLRSGKGDFDRTLGAWLGHRAGRYAGGLRVVVLDKPTSGPDKHRNRYIVDRYLGEGEARRTGMSTLVYRN